MTNNDEMIETTYEEPVLTPEEEADKAEKMKRMAIAVKGVGGWFCYFMGMAALAFGTLTPLGTDYFSVVFGLILICAGIVLLHMHIRAKVFTSKERIVKGVKTISLLLLIPGFLGRSILAFNPGLQHFFTLFLITGLAGMVINMVLRKIWKIKSPKRKKREILTDPAK